jgi:predicted protein tyrosine phosphatase
MNQRSHPSIIVLGYSEAGMLLLRPDAARVKAIISIHGKHEYGVECDVAHRLDLNFDDVEAPDHSDPISAYHTILRNRWDAEHGLTRRPPTVDDALAIIDFAGSIKDVDGIVLCHCGGGVSRAPAAALLCLATWTREGHERSCVERVLKVRPCASPHRDLVRFGDELLNRGGRLVAAVTRTHPPNG